LKRRFDAVKYILSSRIALVLLLVATVASCNKNPNEYEITGKLDNVEDGYFFMSHESGDSVCIDTVFIDVKGEFSFRNEIDTLTEFSLYFNKNTKSTFVLVDKGWKVELKGDVLYPDLIDVKGGDVNDDLTGFKEKNKDLLKSRADILNTAEDSIRDVDSLVVKDYVVELKSINFELSNVAAAYVTANPDKIASVMLINTFFKDETSIPRLDKNLSLLRGKAVDFPLTAELKSFRDKIKLSAVSAYAPSFSLKNIQEKNVQLSDFRGKYVLLSFAATTCNVCRDEKRDAIEIYKKLKKKKVNIEFITIVKDVEQTPLSPDITDSVKWEIAPVKGGWAAKPFEAYYIREIPYNILISPAGIILERDLPIHAVPDKMAELTNTGKK
jgi:thiol-disulfide isomerase/thioredoxin